MLGADTAVVTADSEDLEDMAAGGIRLNNLLIIFGAVSI